MHPGAAGGSLSNLAKGVTSSQLGQQLIVAGVSGAAGNAINNVTSATVDSNTWKGANPLGTLAKVAAAQVHQELPKESLHKVQSEMSPKKVVAIAEAAPAELAQKGPSAKKPLTPDNTDQLKAIDELKPLAHSAEDKQTIQSGEDEYGPLPCPYQAGSRGFAG